MSDGEKLVQKRIEESVRAKRRISQKLMRDIALAADRIVESYAGGGKLILFGNGGSAADAQHIAGEMVGRFLVERRPLEAIALGMNVSTLTAIGNDYGYGRVFERELEATAKPEDVVVAISTSGDSPNVLRAIKRAKRIGCATIAMTGQSGGKLKGEADILLNVPSKGPSPRIQELHILIGHIICELVELGVGANKK
jgi:D-sedoheptulose 7-phosphate isomerase